MLCEYKFYVKRAFDSIRLSNREQVEAREKRLLKRVLTAARMYLRGLNQ